MSPRDTDQNANNPGRGPLGDIDPVDRPEEFPRRVPRDRADDRSSRVNDDDVGADRREREREPDDPQRNPRTGPIG
jgi:hypothetical protein